MRLIYLLALVVVVAVVVLLLHVQFGAPPEPRLGGCDLNDVAGSQAIELLRLSNWLLLREAFGAIVLLVTGFALLYFQVFHRLAAPIAWLGRIAILGALTFLAAISVKWLAESWVANSSGTCLAEAIQAHPSGIATIGRFVPVNWPWAVGVDAATLAVIGAVFGLLAYSAARLARV